WESYNSTANRTKTAQVDLVSDAAIPYTLEFAWLDRGAEDVLWGRPCALNIENINTDALNTDSLDTRTRHTSFFTNDGLATALATTSSTKRGESYIPALDCRDLAFDEHRTAIAKAATAC
ncbi:hypothetical protein CSUB01_12158, partial [Colletotrichum sublineola]